MGEGGLTDRSMGAGPPVELGIGPPPQPIVTGRSSSGKELPYPRGVDAEGAARVIAVFEGRGQLDRLEQVDVSSAHICLDRARARLAAASLLMEAELWESVFTTAYDAYRTAADALVLFLGFRVAATAGAHRIATDIAHGALQSTTEAFAPAGAERFRRGRHESEYFDPACPVDKTAADARWAVDLAGRAIDAVAAAISAS